jgi:hypothetical protein
MKIAAIMILLELPATAGQIDYLVTCPDEATCQMDATIGKYYVDGVWRPDIVLQPIEIWQPANDMTSQETGPDGQLITVVMHQFLPGFSLVISLSQENAVLSASPYVQLVTDRDAAEAGRPFVLQSKFSMDELNTYRLQPVSQGTSYPFGAVQ